jgi:2-isopropylmalate synthase
MGKIVLYDTTLRDGMQTEGVSFSLQDKLMIAQRLDVMGLDYIEGGYAVANPKEMQFFEEAAKLKLKSSKIVAFGNTRRANAKVQDDSSLNAVLACNTSVATLVAKASEMHVKTVLRCSLEQNLTICSESVKYLKDHGLEVIFDAEHFYDGYKQNSQYSMKVLQVAAEAGADCIVLCDTNGGCLPEEIYEITEKVVNQLGGLTIGIHTHNDSDTAAANTFAAVRAGARHVQGTVNGLGERCGNANLCTIIPSLSLKMGFDVLSPEKIRALTELSRFVFELANLPPVLNMPYVGESAFAHKGGLHADAVRKDERTFEHIKPALVGNERRFLISELSGSSSVLAKLEKAKIAEDKSLARKILKAVQDLENKGYQFEAAEGSFDLLVKRILGTYESAFELEKYHVNVEKNAAGKIVTEATVKLNVKGVCEHVVAEGDGPVNALDAALRKSLEQYYPGLKDMHLIDYKVRVVNPRAGTAASVCVVIESRDRDSIWGTVGVDENIIDASWKALVDSVEYKLLKDRK